MSDQMESSMASSQSADSVEQRLMAEIAELRNQVDDLCSQLKDIEKCYNSALDEMADNMEQQVHQAMQEGYAVGYTEAERIAADKDAALLSAVADIQEDYEASMDAHRNDIEAMIKDIRDEADDMQTRSAPQARLAEEMLAIAE